MIWQRLGDSPSSPHELLKLGLTWLENSQIAQDLYLMVEEKKPKIVFLIETKLRSTEMENVKMRLKFEGCLVVDPVGIKGS